MCCIPSSSLREREPRLLIFPFTFKIHIASVTKINVQGQLALERVLGPNLEKLVYRSKILYPTIEGIRSAMVVVHLNDHDFKLLRR